MWTDILYCTTICALHRPFTACIISVKKGNPKRQDSTESQVIKACHGQRHTPGDARLGKNRVRCYWSLRRQREMSAVCGIGILKTEMRYFKKLM